MVGQHFKVYSDNSGIYMDEPREETAFLFVSASFEQEFNEPMRRALMEAMADAAQKVLESAKVGAGC